VGKQAEGLSCIRWHRWLCAIAPAACGALLLFASSPPTATASVIALWGSGVQASLPANASPTVFGTSLNSVSCLSGRNCTAGGGYTDSTPAGQALLVGEASGVWGSGVEAALPANAATNQVAVVQSVSCASAGNCTAVGNYTDNSDRVQGLLLTQTSGTWGVGVEAPLPGNADSARSGRQPQFDFVWFGG
jgi:hypothetical protein